MLVQRIALKNWRNFRDVDVPFRDNTYLLGANATGKSNLLDVFRFLRDISKPQGGGLPEGRCRSRRHSQAAMLACAPAAGSGN